MGRPSDGVVVRLCEVWGGAAPVRVTLHAPFELRDPDGPPGTGPRAGAARGRRRRACHLRPFELVTLRFA